MMAMVLSGMFPLLLSFYPPLKFWRNFKALIFSLGILVVIFGGWDVFAAWRGHWYFNPEGVSGINIINLPVEELVIFYSCPILLYIYLGGA